MKKYVFLLAAIFIYASAFAGDPKGFGKRMAQSYGTQQAVAQRLQDANRAAAAEQQPTLSEADKLDQEIKNELQKIFYDAGEISLIGSLGDDYYYYMIPGSNSTTFQVVQVTSNEGQEEHKIIRRKTLTVGERLSVRKVQDKIRDLRENLRDLYTQCDEDTGTCSQERGYLHDHLHLLANKVALWNVDKINKLTISEADGVTTETYEMTIGRKKNDKKDKNFIVTFDSNNHVTGTKFEDKKTNTTPPTTPAQDQN